MSIKFIGILNRVDGPSLGPQPPPQSFTVIVTKTPCAALAGCNLHGRTRGNTIIGVTAGE